MVASDKSKGLELNSDNVAIEAQVEMPQFIKERPLIQLLSEIGERVTIAIEDKTH